MMRRMSEGGLLLRQIARILNRRGFTTKRGLRHSYQTVWFYLRPKKLRDWLDSGCSYNHLAADPDRKGRAYYRVSKKMNFETAQQIRGLYAEGLSMQVLAAQYKVSLKAISRIINGQTWRVSA
jgi:hypothetical protein